MIFVSIGDIHGCLAETEVLLAHLTHAEKLDASDRVIFIGDYIDRGKNSKQVVDLLLDFRANYPDTLFLKGNHEDMLLHYLGFKGSNGDMYIKNGGNFTIQSYGLTPDSSVAELTSKIPLTHLDFFKNLELLIESDEFIFVHAGLNPKKSFSKQKTDDLFWIREGFIDSEHPFEKIVVFGHTPHAEVVYDLPWKIGIDTGLVYGNSLSCIELRERKVYQVPKQARYARVSSFPSE